MFVEQYAGGAELTSESIIKAAPEGIIIKKILTSTLTQRMIDHHKEYLWVICNFAGLSDEFKIYFCKNKISYTIIEYDYKFCKYRSMEKHEYAEGKACDCNELPFGKINKIFYGYAKQIWFMSAKQQNIFHDKVQTIKEENTSVLSSIFADGDLRFIDNIRHNEKNSKYIILQSPSWIKGTGECVEYAKSHNLDFDLVHNLPYPELLIKLSQSRGLIFRPLGGDTCPRIVIEAKLLGCELVLNGNVQHKDEKWFNASYEEMVAYLKGRASVFWKHYE